MSKVTYRIVPAVLNDGTPMFQLYRDWHLVTVFGLADGTKLIAQNPDRRVIERAIEHLQDTASEAK